jgi:hypothetical protein
VRRLDGSNLREVIERCDSIPHEEGGDPALPDVARLLEGRLNTFLGGSATPEQLDEYDVWMQSSGDGGGFGDPLDRDISLIAQDLENGLTTRRSAEKVYGVAFASDGSVDPAATADRRARCRRERLARGVSASEYRAATRERILTGDLPEHVRAMLRDVFKTSPHFKQQYIEFWNLAADFEV